jgi:hypothetical protein
VATIVDAAEYLQNMACVWKNATDEERRDMVRAILDEVVCDPEQRRIVVVRPKAAFAVVFRQMGELIQHDGTFELGG